MELESLAKIFKLFVYKFYIFYFLFLLFYLITSIFVYLLIFICLRLTKKSRMLQVTVNCRRKMIGIG